jgi:hypothetical protein
MKGNYLQRDGKVKKANENGGAPRDQQWPEAITILRTTRTETLKQGGNREGIV